MALGQLLGAFFPVVVVGLIGFRLSILNYQCVPGSCRDWSREGKGNLMFRVAMLAVLFLLSVTVGSAQSFSIPTDPGSWTFSDCGAICTSTPQSDESYAPKIEPTYGPGEGSGPIVAVDTTHDNHHTISGGYAGFAKLLRADGMRVEDFSVKFPAHDCADSGETAEACAGDRSAYLQALSRIDILVIVNAKEPISADEAEVISGWLSGELACSEHTHCGDRGLFLIADHERDADFPAKIVSLSEELGLDWPNYTIGLLGEISTADNGASQYGIFDNRDPRIKTANGAIVFEIDESADAIGGQLSADNPIILGRRCGEKIRRVKTFLGSGIVDGPGESLLTIASEDALWWYDEGEIGETMGKATGYSQGMTFRHGRGRVYASGEAAMFTAQPNNWGMQQEGIDNEQYLLNIVHWLDGILELEDQVLIDTDGDGYCDLEDNCCDVPNATQFDGDDDGYGNACDSDFNNDGAVGMDDVGELLRGLNTVSPAMDLDEDGVVGLADLITAYYTLGTTPGPSMLAED